MECGAEDREDRRGAARAGDLDGGGRVESPLGNECLRVRPNKNVRLVLIHCRWSSNEANANRHRNAPSGPNTRAEAPCYRARKKAVDRAELKVRPQKRGPT